MIRAISPRMDPAPTPRRKGFLFALLSRNQKRNQNEKKYMASGMKYAEYELIGPSTERSATNNEIFLEATLRQDK